MTRERWNIGRRLTTGGILCYDEEGREEGKQEGGGEGMSVVAAFRRASTAGEEEDQHPSDHPYYPFRLCSRQSPVGVRTPVCRLPHLRSPSAIPFIPNWFHDPLAILASFSALKGTLGSNVQLDRRSSSHPDNHRESGDGPARKRGMGHISSQSVRNVGCKLAVVNSILCPLKRWCPSLARSPFPRPEHPVVLGLVVSS